jgi:hypothetical protein
MVCQFSGKAKNGNKVLFEIDKVLAYGNTVCYYLVYENLSENCFVLLFARGTAANK